VIIEQQIPSTFRFNAPWHLADNLQEASFYYRSSGNILQINEQRMTLWAVIIVVILQFRSILS
jgi:hypothetical protein